MALFGGSNPMMNEDKFTNLLDSQSIQRGEKMTVTGTVNKTVMLTIMLLATAGVGFLMPNLIFLYGGAIIGLIAVLVSIFRPQYSNIAAPVYAIFKGLAVGTISAAYAAAFDGIVFHAFISTIGILGAMLFIYKSRVIEVTEKFKFGIMMATAGIALVYVVDLVLHLFGINTPYLHEGGAIGIGLSVFVVIIATLNLLVDFDNIEKGAAHNAPKYMEWYSAMGLLVTLVWLYLELLRLMAKLASRD